MPKFLLEINLVFLKNPHRPSVNFDSLEVLLKTMGGRLGTQPVVLLGREDL